MKTFAWLLKNVVLPLAPFLVGALIRGLHSGNASWEYRNRSQPWSTEVGKIN